MEELVKKILQGDKASLEKLVTEIQPGVFNISLRFLWIRQDAEDATQEILIKIISNLSKFEGKSKFSTWVYRVAVNHLLNLKKNKLEERLNFSYFGEDLINGLQAPAYDAPDKKLLTEEVKIGCTLGMLLCLSREYRVAYILGEVFELASSEAAEILGITPENYRKRLSLARKLLQDFMNGHCGLVNKKNNCRCNKRIQYAIDNKRVNRSALQFVTNNYLLGSKSEMEDLYSVAELFKTHPNFQPAEKVSEITTILNNISKLFNS